MPAIRKQLALWAPVVLWAGLIFYFSSIPGLRIVEAWYDIILRKVAHMGVYAVLYVLLHRAFRGSMSWPLGRIEKVAWMVCVLYAITDEFHQSTVPQRHADPLDVLIDSFGAWIALKALDCLKRRV